LVIGGAADLDLDGDVFGAVADRAVPARATDRVAVVRSPPEALHDLRCFLLPVSGAADDSEQVVDGEVEADRRLLAG
jgi:hypothetical protein